MPRARDRHRACSFTARSGGRPARLTVLLALLPLLAPAAFGDVGRNIPFTRISLDQGLSQATVMSFLQDQSGFMWIGTLDGLNRYDGYTFLVYKNDPEDPATLGANWVQALLEDPAGDIWAGTRGGGLSRWRRASDTFETYRHDPDDPASLSSNEVRALLLDRGGILWVGTERSGLNRFEGAVTAPREAGQADSGVVRYRHDPDNPSSLADDQIRALAEDHDGTIWVGTIGGLCRLERPATGREPESFVCLRHDPGDPGSLSMDYVRSLLVDRGGNLWVGTFGGGLDRLRRGATTFDHFAHDPSDPASLSENRARALYEDREGRLWVGTDGGLNFLDPASGTFARYRHDPADARSLATDRVAALFQDRGGVLWVGTSGGGICTWDPRTWSFANEAIRPSQLSGRDVLSFTEDHDGVVWVGTSGGGLNRLDRAAGTVTHFRHDPNDPASLAEDRVTALITRRNGELWVGTLAGGLDRFDAVPGRASGTFEHFRHDPADPTSLSSNSVVRLFENRQGALWLGTFGGGLNRFEPRTRTFVSFRHDPEDPTSLSDDRVTAIAEDRRGFLWLGSFGSGLNRFDPPSGTALRFAHDSERPESLSNNIVPSVHVTPAGVVWIATQVGLNRLVELDEATGRAVFRRYLEKHGLPSNIIYGIESDGGGGLWLATNRGLSRFDPRTETFKNFDTSHGLSSNEFNTGAHYRAASGELFFGGIDGFNAFYPDRIELNTQAPPVLLTAFSKLNRPVRLERPIFDVDRVELDYRDSIFSFEFAALDYAAPARNRYRYRLEGFDEEWIDHGNRRRVSFTNLDPGGYVLRVLGSNNDGVWNEEGASITLSVSPPPWRTWWAYGLYGLALLAAVRIFVRMQRRRIEREREREVNRRLREVDELRGELLANLKTVVAERTAQVEEREALLAERERLIGELEGTNAELERFNYTVSHDLKSPLVTILGFLGMLERDTAAGNTEGIRDDIHRIKSAAEKMGHLLDELLQLSRITHQAKKPEAVSLSELSREALELVDGLVIQRAVEVEISTELPVVTGDRTQLLEVYQNLLANAVKYMGEQPAPRVEVGVWRNGPEKVLYVRDNGAGVDPRYHEKIFALFERLNADDEGTGIGLALVKRIVEQHGGRIWVESQGAGCGSTFCFTLPQAAHAGVAEPPSSRPAGA